MRLTFFVTTVLLAALPVARADVIDIKWSAEGHFAHQGTIAAGKFAEVCGKLPALSHVRWSFEANTALNFNVHYHVDKEVVFPTKLTAVAKASDTLAATIAQDYCWMWSNKSAKPATFTVNLQRD